MMQAMASAAGPRAKRAKLPREVDAKDTDGAMAIVDLSRLVRDLCRQHYFDREAWQEMITANQDHAQRIDGLSDESLQTNDQFAGLLEGHKEAMQVQNAQTQSHVAAAVANLTVGIKAVETNMKMHVDNGLTNSTTLLQLLQTKFDTLDAAVQQLRAAQATTGAAAAAPSGDPSAQAAAAAAAATAAAAGAAQPGGLPGRTPLIDPVTGYASAAFTAPGFNPEASRASTAAPAQHFFVGTPMKSEGGQALGQQGADWQPPRFPTPGMTTAQPTAVPPTAEPAQSAAAPPMRAPPGYSQASFPGPSGSAQDTTGWPVGSPWPSMVRGPAGWPAPTGQERKHGIDSKALETKMAQDVRHQYDGGKSGSSWRPMIKTYFMGKIPILKHLLQWAED